MTKHRRTQMIVSVAFAAAISLPPLLQAVSEALGGKRPEVLELFRRLPTAENLQTFERKLEDASPLAATLRPWMQYASFALLGEGGEKAVLGRSGWVFYRPGVRYLLERPKARGEEEPTDDPLEVIVSFRDQLVARGIRLLVIPVPNKESIHPEKFTRSASSFEIAVAPETRNLLDRLRARGVETLDLFELFREAKRRTGEGSADALYLAGDTHWSPRGVEVAADAAARWVLDRGGLERGQVEYEVRPVEIQRTGDLIRMLQVPEIEAHVGPESIRCARVHRREDGSPYVDDPASDVLLIGDSFLRVYEADEPGGAGFLAHLARRLARPLASLVIDGGGSTIVRRELASRPALLEGKRVVIWEFVERDIRFGMEGWKPVALPAVRGR